MVRPCRGVGPTLPSGVHAPLPHCCHCQHRQTPPPPVASLHIPASSRAHASRAEAPRGTYLASRPEAPTLPADPRRLPCQQTRGAYLEDPRRLQGRGDGGQGDAARAMRRSSCLQGFKAFTVEETDDAPLEGALYSLEPPKDCAESTSPVELFPPPSSAPVALAASRLGALAASRGPAGCAGLRLPRPPPHRPAPRSRSPCIGGNVAPRRSSGRP